MVITEVSIKNKRVVAFDKSYTDSVSDDGKSIFVNGWNVEICGSKIICETKYHSIFGSSSYRCEHYLYSENGTLILTDGNFYKRRTYFFASYAQENTENTVRFSQADWRLAAK